MGIRRRKRIEELLRRGGAINKVGQDYSAHHPSETFKLTEEEVAELLNGGGATCGRELWLYGVLVGTPSRPDGNT